MWNYRILAHEHDGEVTLQVHEVHYDETGKPKSYSETPAKIMGDTVRELRHVATMILLDLGMRRPILWAGDRWPEVYKPEK
jgi:hypothetical protein